MNKVQKEITKFTCFYLPPNVNSDSMLINHKRDGSWLNSSMPRFEFMAFFILVVTQACHFVLKQFGFPLFLSQLIAGKILSEAMNHHLKFAEDGVKVLSTIATIGYAAFVFQIGVKTDLGMIRRAGKKSVCIGCFSLVAATVCGLATSRYLIKDRTRFQESFTVTVLTTSITSFPVITSFLNDLKIVNTELGRIGQSAALIGDILSMILINCTLVMRLYVDKPGKAYLVYLGSILGFLFVVVFIIRPAMNWIVRNTPTNGRVKDVYVYGVLCIFFGFTSLARWFPQYIMASYILGLAIPTGTPLGSVIVEKFDGLTSGLFMPLFVATCGMRTNFSSINKLQRGQIVKNLIVIGVTQLAKFLASFSILAFTRFPIKDGCVLAIIMCTKGFVEIATLSFLSDSGIFTNDLLRLMTIAVVIIASFTSIIVKILYDPSKRYTAYERRTIMHLSPNSNLQILTCIHVPNHISSVITLLEASGASGESPIGVHALHLIKLSGQAAPVFISHDRRKRNFSENCSYSGNVILSFTKFEANNWGAVSVDLFTAVSTPNLMYEDVCTLALDRSASLIVLPFHRRWYPDGAVESNDNTTRVLNQMVLDRAPCSVAILVDRGYKRRITSSESSITSMESAREFTQNVAMIFLGGNDDREALVYAMRMAEDPNISLTVAHLVATDDVETTSWSKVLDLELLKKAKSARHIRYVEHEVKDGPDTTIIIRSMMTRFDMFIVGRAKDIECQQTQGLGEWMEYPELGAIGDIFASSDVEEKFLVLVVQQQHLTTS
ncbi:hypothetical protein ACFE04_003980 [Oxalis oulophora]